MDEKEKLYNALVEQGLYSKSFQDFDNQFSSPEKVGSLYNSLKERDLVSIPQSRFQNKYFSEISASDQPVSADQGISDTEIPQNEITPQDPNMEASEETGVLPQVEEFLNGVMRSGVSGFGQTIESLGTLSDQLRKHIGMSVQIGEGEDAQRSIFSNMGREIQEAAHELFPDNPEVRNNFVNSTVPQALGSTMSFVAAGAAGGGAAAAVTGGMQLGQTAFEEAKQAGADDATATKAFLVNMPLGGLEAIPVSRLFSRLNKATGGSFTNAIKQGAVGGVEEAVQETTQQYLSNAAAINIYDQSRDLIDGVGEGGAAGFVVGFMLNAIGAKVGDMRNREDLAPQEEAELRKTETFVNQKKQELRQEKGQVSTEEFQESIKIPDQFAQPPRRPKDDIPRDPRERGAFTTQKDKGTLSGDFKKEFQEKGERLYDPIPDRETKDIATDFVDRHGLRGAKEAVFNPDNELTMAQRVAVGQKILNDLDQEYQAKRESDPEVADTILDEQIGFANRVYKFGTELGRAVRAFAYHSHFSPEAFTRIYERGVKDAEKARSTHPLFGRKKPEVSEDVKKEITKRVKEAKKKPEGFQRERAILDVMGYIAKQTPPSNTDIGISLAYANLLSGHETHIVNMSSTAINTLLETGTMVASNPSLAPDAFMGLYRGFFKGMVEAKDIVKTGHVTGTRRTTKLDDIPNALESTQFKGIFSPLNGWKYVRRLMAAEDVVFFKAAEESRARMLAKHMAKQEGGSEAEIRARTEQILGTSPAQVEKARNQALNEGLEEGSDDFKRRVAEISEQQRPIELREEATDFGLRSTFNNKPDGVLGDFAQMINGFSKKHPAAKAIVPFTNVVANVTNRMIDYTPFGWTRLNQWSKDSANPEFGSDRWKQQLAKAFLGSSGMMTVALINGMAMEEDDPVVEITGRGPDNFRDRFQLQETGWKDYSVKIGDRYYSYKETPMALAFGLVANYTDAVKYGTLSEDSIMRRSIYALNAAPQTVMNQSFLTGLQDFFTVLSQENLLDDDNPLSGAIGMGRAFGIPNAWKQIDRIFDPRVMTDDDIEEALLRDIPVARSMKGSPIINVLGDPIRNDYTFSDKALKRFMSTQKSDPIWRTIVDKKAFISHPSQNQIKVTQRGSRRSLTPDEYYNYILLSGRDIKRTLRVNLGKIRAMPEPEAQDFVNKIVRNARSAARDRIERSLVGAEKLGVE